MRDSPDQSVCPGYTDSVMVGVGGGGGDAAGTDCVAAEISEKCIHFMKRLFLWQSGLTRTSEVYVIGAEAKTCMGWAEDRARCECIASISCTDADADVLITLSKSQESIKLLAACIN